MPEFLDLVFNLPIEGPFTYSLPKSLEAEQGVRVAAPFRGRRLVGYVVGQPDGPPPGVTTIKEIQRVVDQKPLFDEALLKLARWMSTMYICSLGEALAAILPGGKRETEPDVVEPGDNDRGKYEPADQQLRAIERINRQQGGTFYLHGVTGSGKTEVFLQAARKTVAEGRGVIYLVPEISLTHQVLDLFRAEFGERLAVLHSGLTPSSRLKEWHRIREGKAMLVVGARSAVFAPMARLGLIVIDEEHEGSYKSSSTPRYHARQVAMHRSRQQGATLLMGSATPSLEAYYHMQQGDLERLSLPARLSGGTMPRVTIQDMKGEIGPLSRNLIAAIRRAHAGGRQTILFLNRRGFAYFFHCRSCGYSCKCRNCSVSMTYHKKRDRLVCHYCGHQEKTLAVCPECGSLDIGYSGFGTERIEEEVAGLFPDLTVERIDTDAVRQKKVLRRVLQDFRSGAIDILLGTQMVAKGLNFPGVKLVGIVSADTGLQLPDFRASERTFSLILQVSGRAGRYHPDGEVLVQTNVPENATIQLAATADLERFYQQELKAREEQGFPPFSRLIRLVFRSANAKKARSAAADFKRLIYSGIHSGQAPAAAPLPLFDTLGPAECPLAIISGKHRIHIIFRTLRFADFHQLMRSKLRAFTVPSGVYVEVDVDPVSLL